jgi:plastocyanin
VRKLLVALAVACLAAALALPALAATRSVRVGDNFFVKKGTHPTISVSRGTTVKWVWRGHNPHNVTVKRGPVRFHSRTIDHGSFSKRMRRAGLYSIVCTVHPGMRMKLRVR